MQAQLIRPDIEWFKTKLSLSEELIKPLYDYKSCNRISKEHMKNLWRVSFKITNYLFSENISDRESSDSIIIHIARILLEPSFLKKLGTWMRYDDKMCSNPKDSSNLYMKLLYESITGCRSLLNQKEHTKFQHNISILGILFETTLITTRGNSRY